MGKATVEFDLNDVLEIVELVAAKKYVQAVVKFVQMFRERRASVAVSPNV